MLASIGTYDICDGTLAGGFAIGQLRYQIDRGTEVVIPLDGDDPEIFSRGGNKFAITFIVQRIHASAAAAESFIVGLEAALPTTGTVIVGGATIPNGKLVSHSSQQTGATTTTTYTITGEEAS